MSDQTPLNEPIADKAETLEALEAAIDFIWPLYPDDREAKMDYAKQSTDCKRLALILDRFAERRVREQFEKLGIYLPKRGQP